MNWTKGKLAVVASAAVGFIAGAGIVGFNAFADTTSGQSSTTTPATQVEHHHANFVRFSFHKSLPQLAEFFGMTEQQLSSELHSGKSLNAIAVEHSKTADSLQTELKSLVHSSLEQHVTSGSMSQDKETSVEQKVDSRLPQMAANTTWMKPRGHSFSARVDVLGQVAKDLKMNRQDLITQLKSGQSIAAIAQAKGVSVSTLTSELEQTVDSKINDRVAAMLTKSDWFNHQRQPANPTGNTNTTGQ